MDSLAFHVLRWVQVILKVVVECVLVKFCILLLVDIEMLDLNLFIMLLVAYKFHSVSDCSKCQNPCLVRLLIYAVE